MDSFEQSMPSIAEGWILFFQETSPTAILIDITALALFQAAKMFVLADMIAKTALNIIVVKRPEHRTLPLIG